MKPKHLLAPLVAISLMAGCEKAPETKTEAPASPDTPQAAAGTSPDETAPPAAEPVAGEEVTVTIQEEPSPSPAAEEPDTQLPDPVATVNGAPISREEFEKTLGDVFSSMGMQPSSLPPDQREMLYRQFAEDMVIDKIIDQASAGVQVSPEEIDKELANIAQQYGSRERFAEELAATGQTMDEFKGRLAKLIRQRKFIEAQAGESAQVSDAEVRAFYDNNKAEFEQPDVVRASHILIRVEEGADDATVEAKKKQAEDLAAKAKGGEDFAKLAAEFSEDPTAKQNAGDLNYFPRERMVPQFAEAAFTQEVGVVGDPVRTPFGWHIIKVTDKKPAQVLPFDQVKGDIADYLKEQQQQQAVEKVIQKLRGDADVEIFIPEPQMPQIPAVDIQVQETDAAAPAAQD